MALDQGCCLQVLYQSMDLIWSRSKYCGSCKHSHVNGTKSQWTQTLPSGKITIRSRKKRGLIHKVVCAKDENENMYRDN